MEVPRLGVEWELLLPAYAPATATQYLSHISNLHHTAHGNARFPTHWARPGIEPTSLWILVRFLSIAPQCELPKNNFFKGKKRLLNPFNEIPDQARQLPREDTCHTVWFKSPPQRNAWYEEDIDESTDTDVLWCSLRQEYIWPIGRHTDGQIFNRKPATISFESCTTSHSYFLFFLFLSCISLLQSRSAQNPHQTLMGSQLCNTMAWL